MLVHYGRIDRRDDCETLPSTASEDSRYNAHAALSGVRQSSQHEAPIYIVRECASSGFDPLEARRE